MTEGPSTTWRVWTETYGLAWLDPGPAHPALRDAIWDCASSLSPSGSKPALSTYWVDRLLNAIRVGRLGEIAHGDLWVLTRVGDWIEVRMDVDPATSAPMEVVDVHDLESGLNALRTEVLKRLVESHELDDRYWAQRNP